MHSKQGFAVELTNSKMPVTVFGAVHPSRWVVPNQHRLNRAPILIQHANQQILGKAHLVDRQANVSFLSSCQFKYGGISKAPGERPGIISLYNVFGTLTLVQIHITHTWP
jgi:hypothetical protein